MHKIKITCITKYFHTQALYYSAVNVRLKLGVKTVAWAQITAGTTVASQRQ